MTTPFVVEFDDGRTSFNLRTEFGLNLVASVVDVGDRWLVSLFSPDFGDGSSAGQGEVGSYDDAASLAEAYARLCARMVAAEVGAR